VHEQPPVLNNSGSLAKRLGDNGSGKAEVR
jgi:hypothetical protein